MYEVRFYRDRNGRQPALDYLRELAKGKDKDSRIRARKMQEYLRQYRTIPGTHLACIMFRHIARKSWPIQEVFPAIFRQSDENSDCAICAPELCGIALNLLQEFGTYIGEPAVKHLEGDIWELRPARDRVLFVAWHNNGYVLLHAFEKQTQKTPEREKQRARKEYADLKERGLDDE